MKTGQEFEGDVAELRPASIRLDFTFSRQKMTGVVTFPRTDVAGARKFPALTKQEKTDILEKRRQGLLEARQAWTATVGAQVAASAKPVQPTAEQKAATEQTDEEKQMADYRALLAEFPPDQGWGPERLAEIRHRHFIIGLTPTYQERRFWQLFDQWSEAKTKVELYDQRQKQEQETLLTLFPPEEGWNATKKQQLEEKQKSGEQLTKLEAQFLTSYDAWQKAVAAKPAAGQAPTPIAPAAGAPTPPAPTPPTEPAPTPPTPPVPAPATPPASPPASEAQAPPAPGPASAAPASPAPEPPEGSGSAKP
jgi:hypothetical protein